MSPIHLNVWHCHIPGRFSRAQNHLVGANYLCFVLNLTAAGFISYLLAAVWFGHSEELFSIYLLHSTDDFTGFCCMSLQQSLFPGRRSLAWLIIPHSYFQTLFPFKKYFPFHYVLLKGRSRHYIQDLRCSHSIFLYGGFITNHFLTLFFHALNDFELML